VGAGPACAAFGQLAHERKTTIGALCRWPDRAVSPVSEAHPAHQGTGLIIKEYGKKWKLRLSSFEVFGAECRIACRLLFATTSLTMSDGAHLTTWVDRETKSRFAAVARHQGLSDSALLKRLIEMMLQAGGANAVGAIPADDRIAKASRLSIRLRPDDEILLRERAGARRMPAATYVSVLTRAHLRSLSPLPKEELLALKRTVSELGSIGRNLNQIARAAHQGSRVMGAGRDDLRAILRVCEALRDHVKELLAANIKSWVQGYGEPGV
jgi:hypothetical protein